MTTRPASQTSQTLAWDHENRLESVSSAGVFVSEDYLYDADGMRVKKTSDGKASYYPLPPLRAARRRGGQVLLLQRHARGAAQGEQPHHLPARQPTWAARYWRRSVIGIDINDQQYFAYGAQRDTGPVNTENQFTDQKRDETGLYYYGARYYDPALGTFISPDSIVPNASHVFGYNRFMYGYGNPLRYDDPDGHCPVTADGGRDPGSRRWGGTVGT